MYLGPKTVDKEYLWIEVQPGSNQFEKQVKWFQPATDVGQPNLNVANVFNLTQTIEPWPKSNLFQI